MNIRFFPEGFEEAMVDSDGEGSSTLHGGVRGGPMFSLSPMVSDANIFSIEVSSSCEPLVDIQFNIGDGDGGGDGMVNWALTPKDARRLAKALLLIADEADAQVN